MAGRPAGYRAQAGDLAAVHGDGVGGSQVIGDDDRTLGQAARALGRAREHGQHAHADIAHVRRALAHLGIRVQAQVLLHGLAGQVPGARRAGAAAQPSLGRLDEHRVFEEGEMRVHDLGLRRIGQRVGRHQRLDLAGGDLQGGMQARMLLLERAAGLIELGCDAAPAHDLADRHPRRCTHAPERPGGRRRLEDRRALMQGKRGGLRLGSAAVPADSPHPLRSRSASAASACAASLPLPLRRTSSPHRVAAP